MTVAILRRTAILLASVLAASIVVFLFMAVLPGDPAQVALGVNATPELVERTRQEFGLDRPLLTQYLEWMGGVLTGDFGTSYVTREAIGPQLLDRLGVTLWLVGAGMLVALLIAIPFGTVAAVRHRKPSGALVSALSQFGVAVPAFLAGIVLVQIFAVRLGWLPSGGWTPPNQDPVEWLRGLILPALSLGLVQGAVLTRYVRSAVLDVGREDYIRTARSKGLRPYPALVRHGLRNAAIPVVTVLGLQLATLLVGAVVVEKVFVLPGMGSMLLDSVAARDLLTVQGIVLVLVVAVLVVNFVVDVLYAVLDPRLRAS
ncbi:ABC transporter permease [Prauserella marina]|uniref:Peptide/nickel transport system permease protein n=1 Tax=Prauserella marina TaxID=530584 RepID=A0A222VIM6_9PSEU|nr:ABC transporter permease [Prauserella marina]ASR33682.1 ABC transporter permease [Prauserella marina]PWV82231.1 peptide/nickel transport system permease protein [Prauserella marina]SDC63785.1 peptide/nickel transport system permease protein [Prauserella marina]